MKNKIDHDTDLEKALEADLLREYGPLLTGNSLCKALGYPSLEALRQAVARHKVPVPVFSLPNRRGKFALSKDVATWLADQRNRAV